MMLLYFLEYSVSDIGAAEAYSHRFDLGGTAFLHALHLELRRPRIWAHYSKHIGLNVLVSAYVAVRGS